MQNNQLNEELAKWKRINSRNNLIIIVLLGVLAFVSVVAIYVRFFG